MTRRAFFLPFLLLALSARAEPVPGAFRGLTLSLGPGLPVCARVTFDRKIAESGGRVFVLDAASEGDEQAIRMAEAVIVRRAGLSSARRRLAATACPPWLGQGRWDGRGPALYSIAVYGTHNGLGLLYRPVTGYEQRALREGGGDRGRGERKRDLVPASQAQACVAAAEAARAYDGFATRRRLFSGLSRRKRGPRRGLLRTGARAVAGSCPPTTSRACRRSSVGPASVRGDMRRAEASAFTRAAARPNAVPRIAPRRRRGRGRRRARGDWARPRLGQASRPSPACCLAGRRRGRRARLPRRGAPPREIPAGKPSSLRTPPRGGGDRPRASIFRRLRGSASSRATVSRNGSRARSTTLLSGCAENPSVSGSA